MINKKINKAEPTILELPEITTHDGVVDFISADVTNKHRGTITVIENKKQIPFEIKRVYYLYNVDENGSRGGHAHKNLEQMIIAINGSVDVVTDNGHQIKKFSLTKPTQALYLPKMTWRELINLESNTICLVIASEYYTDKDYIRNYQKFKSLARKK